MMDRLSAQTYDTLVNFLSSALAGLIMFVLGLATGWLLWRNFGRRLLQEAEQVANVPINKTFGIEWIPQARETIAPTRGDETEEFPPRGDWAVGLNDQDYAALHRAGLNSPERIAALTEGEAHLAQRRWPHISWDELRQKVTTLVSKVDTLDADQDADTQTPLQSPRDLTEEDLLKIPSLGILTTQQLRRTGIVDRRRIAQMTDEEIQIAERRWKGVNWMQIRDELRAALPPEEPTRSKHDGEPEENVIALESVAKVDSSTIQSLLLAGITTVNRIRTWTEEEFRIAQRRWPHVDWATLRTEGQT